MVDILQTFSGLDTGQSTSSLTVHRCSRLIDFNITSSIIVEILNSTGEVVKSSFIQLYLYNLSCHPTQRPRFRQVSQSLFQYSSQIQQRFHTWIVLQGSVSQFVAELFYLQSILQVQSRNNRSSDQGYRNQDIKASVPNS